MLSFAAVTQTLARLLKVRFLPGKGAAEGPVGRSLESVLELHNLGDFAARDHELNRLSLLARQLKTIETHDAALLEHFRRKLGTGNEGEYAGARFEVTVCAMLIANKLAFSKGEAPDFTVTVSPGSALVECTTAQLSAPKEGDLKYKITSALRAKAAKPYAGPDLALFVEVTNLLHHMSQSSIHTNLDNVLAAITADLRSTSVGSVVLFSYLFEAGDASPDPSVRAWRLDNLDVAPPLRALLNLLFPGALGPPDVSAIPLRS